VTGEHGLTSLLAGDRLYYKAFLVGNTLCVCRCSHSNSAGVSMRHETIVIEKMACPIQHTQGCALGEPAVAIPDERDNESVFEEAKISPRPRASTFDVGSLQSTQRGALFRRTSAMSPSASPEGLLFNRPEKHLHSL
jgi:hypothetical protein